MSSRLRTPGVAYFLAKSDGSLDSATLAKIKSGGFTKVVIAGGTSAVSAAAANQIKAAGITVERYGGATRYDTSLLFADWAANNSPSLSWYTVGFATGKNFPDAITGAVSQGHIGGVLLLVDDTANGAKFLSTYKSKGTTKVLFYGGTSAIPNSLRNKITG